MDTTKLALNTLAGLIGTSPTKLAVGAVSEAVDCLMKWVNSAMEDEKEKRKEFKDSLRTMTDDELRETYVPDVYQKYIYDIDYQKLWEAGIRLISFDIDDTIGDTLSHNIRKGIPGCKITMYDEGKKAEELVKKLHGIGFKVILLTNAGETIAKGVYREIGADDYIDSAEKPDPKSFYTIMEKCGFDKSQMAHVGNNIRQDVAGGNAAGVTTCLVRNNGFAMDVGKTLLRITGHRSKGHLVREELKNRWIWRKHHKFHKNDQYYQLGETPKYL